MIKYIATLLSILGLSMIIEDYCADRFCGSKWVRWIGVLLLCVGPLAYVLL